MPGRSYGSSSHQVLSLVRSAPPTFSPDSLLPVFLSLAMAEKTAGAPPRRLRLAVNEDLSECGTTEPQLKTASVTDNRSGSIRVIILWGPASEHSSGCWGQKTPPSTAREKPLAQHPRQIPPPRPPDVPACDLSSLLSASRRESRVFLTWFFS